MKNDIQLNKGLSVIEVILAAAVFVIFASGIAQAVIGGFGSNRLGEEQTVANQFASEGLEAVRSIKNQSFANLVNTASTGISQAAGVWTFSGANNQFGPSNKYTRVITVTDVQRDASGNIVASGGVLDSLTKKITSTVSWNAGPTRANSVVLSSYMTDFRKSIQSFGALAVYGDGTTIPKYRTYDTSLDSFSAQTSMATSSAGRSFVLRTSPSKTEALAGFVTSTGVLNIQCFDGTNWVQEWTATVGGTGATRPFDIAYETNSGDAIVLYSGNTAPTNELRYKTKSGSNGCGTANWSAESNFDAQRTIQSVQWVKMAWDKRGASNLITAIWADSDRDLSATVWDGGTWGNEPSTVSETQLQVMAGAQSDSEDFDVEYESSSGDSMIIWGTNVGSGVNGVRYRTCTGGVALCTWSAVTTPPTFVDDATNLDISANPNTDEIIFASIGKNQVDMQIGYWSGSAWTNNAAVDTSTIAPMAGTKLVSTGWLISGSTTRSVVVYNDDKATNIGWYVCNLAVCTLQTDFINTPKFANPQKYYDIQMDPINKDKLVFMASDNGSDLFAETLTMTSAPAFTWTDSDGGSVLEATLGQAINSPFSFAFFRN